MKGAAAGFEGVRFIHNALPEVAAAELDTTESFLGQKVALPFFISCMTGGSEGGFKANRQLAAAAQELGIPVGLGSIRVLQEDPALFPHFHVKPIAPDVPVLANISAVQVRDGDIASLLALVQRLEAQALVVHLNAGQELFQPEGDRDFRGLKQAIARLCEASAVPVIVKETGFGIVPSLVRELLRFGRGVRGSRRRRRHQLGDRGVLPRVAGRAPRCRGVRRLGRAHGAAPGGVPHGP